MASLETYVRVRNETNTRAKLFVNEVVDYDWDGVSRPDKNLHGRVIEAYGALEKREEINAYASRCMYRLHYHMENGDCVNVRIDQKLALIKSVNNYEICCRKRKYKVTLEGGPIDKKYILYVSVKLIAIEEDHASYEPDKALASELDSALANEYKDTYISVNNYAPSAATLVVEGVRNSEWDSYSRPDQKLHGRTMGEFSNFTEKIRINASSSQCLYRLHFHLDNGDCINEIIDQKLALKKNMDPQISYICCGKRQYRVKLVRFDELDKQNNVILVLVNQEFTPHKSFEEKVSSLLDPAKAKEVIEFNRLVEARIAECTDEPVTDESEI